LGIVTIVPRHYGLSPGQAGGQEPEDGGEEKIPATEDLMREHGVPDRVLLVYEEAVRRLRDHEDLPPEVFQAAASLVRTFVEDYHERLEEKFIFPELEKQQKLLHLVTTLLPSIRRAGN
jgi:hypothetical protein